jgi:hypothetical protein
VNFDTWQFKVERWGKDLMVCSLKGGPVRATCFGGDSDPQDNGETASGINTKANPALQACSLPMRLDRMEALRGSPIPRLPWFTKIEVTQTEAMDEGCVDFAPKFVFTLIDLGPGKRTGNAIDLTIAAARKFKPNATASNFGMRCWVRIIGGAKYA